MATCSRYPNVFVQVAALEIQLVLFEDPVHDCSLGILHYAEVRHKSCLNLFIIRDAFSYNVAKQYL